MNTPILTDRTCLTCKHKVVEGAGKAKPQMFCRRNPPTATILMIPGPQGVAPVPVAAFPPVQPDMWCGEHKPRIEHAHAGASDKEGLGRIGASDAFWVKPE